MPKRTPDEGPSQWEGKNGRIRVFTNPHSPFQRMLWAAMERKQLSLRQSAKLIGISPSTLWLWLHNQDGFPGRTFEEWHLETMVARLDLDEVEFRDAINTSRIAYGHRAQIPVPQLRAAFDDFIDMIEAKDSVYLRRAWVLSLAKRLRDGASIEAEKLEVEKSRAPKSKKSPARKKRAPAKKKKPGPDGGSK